MTVPPAPQARGERIVSPDNRFRGHNPIPSLRSGLPVMSPDGPLSESPGPLPGARVAGVLSSGGHRGRLSA